MFGAGRRRRVSSAVAVENFHLSQCKVRCTRRRCSTAKRRIVWQLRPKHTPFVPVMVHLAAIVAVGSVAGLAGVLSVSPPLLAVRAPRVPTIFCVCSMMMYFDDAHAESDRHYYREAMDSSVPAAATSPLPLLYLCPWYLREGCPDASKTTLVV